jgi:hypothetical protein
MQPHGRRPIRPRLLVAIFAAALTMMAAASALADITYVYDSGGRLIAVVDGAGNILSIANSTGSRTAIYSISPNKGPVGTQVTIYGDGFSTTPSQNTVTFSSGKNASVTASTLTTITTTVPTGAVTGSVSVTSPNGSGSTNFTVN